MSLSGLARAAVAGDEKALDLFSSWRPSDANRFRQEQHRHSGGSSRGAGPNTAFAGSTRGVIYCLSENGSCMEVLQAEGPVRKLLLTSKNELVVVTESMVIGQFRVEHDGTVGEVSRVKLSTRTKENHIAWVDDTHLAVNSGDMTVRVWNLKTDANFVLTAEAEGASMQFITCLSYCSPKRLVAAGTNTGNIAMWRNHNKKLFDEEEGWRAMPNSNVGTAVRSLSWGADGDVCALNTVRQVFFLHEQDRAVAFHDGITATQVMKKLLLLLLLLLLLFLCCCFCFVVDYVLFNLNKAVHLCR